MRSYKLAPKAKADLQKIYDHIVADDPQTAKAVMQRIDLLVMTIRQFPGVGKPTQRAGIYIFGGSAKTPFRITFACTNDEITIIRVFRATREHILF